MASYIHIATGAIFEFGVSMLDFRTKVHPRQQHGRKTDKSPEYEKVPATAVPKTKQKEPA